MPVQLGWCNGHNTKLNCLEYHRDSYYNKEAEDQRACKCIVAKNRHGETNDINMIWDGQYTRFTDVDVYKRQSL